MGAVEERPLYKVSPKIAGLWPGAPPDADSIFRAALVKMALHVDTRVSWCKTRENPNPLRVFAQS